MKILYVNTLYPPDVGGGAELTLAMLAGGHRANGHEVLVAATTGGSAVVDDVVGQVPVTRLPLHNLYWPHAEPRPGPLRRIAWHARDIDNRAMAEALTRVVQRFDPDVISFHNLAGFSASAWGVAKQLRKPAVQVLHDYYHLCPRSQLFGKTGNCDTPCRGCSAFRIGRGQASNALQAVVGVSQAVLDAHLRNGLFAEVPMRKVINNARDFAPAAPVAYAARATTFGFIGTVAPWKGIALLLEAFERLRAEPGMGPLRLLVAGTGEAGYLSALRARFDSGQIEFLGKVAPDSFFRQIDVSVVPSLWHDPLPGVVYESMIFGVPVIGARRGGIPEMLSHDSGGLLFDPDVPGELEACMRRLATTPGLLRRHGERAHKASAPYADMPRVIAAHLDIYETLLAA